MSIARIKKNDTVIVIAGADKGKTGKVLSVSPTVFSHVISLLPSEDGVRDTWSLEFTMSK